MIGYRLRLHAAPDFDLDLRAVTPDRVQSLGVEKLKRLRLAQGRKRVALGDLFDVAGTPGPELAIEGVTPRLHHLGAGMTGGVLRLAGNCGASLGADMRGGEIHLRGNAGDAVGSGMRGGLIDVSGSVGAAAGGCLPGAGSGMRNGTILVGRNAGPRLGESMRRGTIVVAGDAGDGCGNHLIAGTLVVLGRVGARTGFGMRRGTLLLRAAPDDLMPTFVDTGSYALAFLPLLIRHLTGLKPALRTRLRAFTTVRRLVGDAACAGLGEILIPTAEAT